MKKLTKILALTLCMAFLFTTLPSYDDSTITTCDLLVEEDPVER